MLRTLQLVSISSLLSQLLLTPTYNRVEIAPARVPSADTGWLIVTGTRWQRASRRGGAWAPPWGRARCRGWSSRGGRGGPGPRPRPAEPGLNSAIGQLTRGRGEGRCTYWTEGVERELGIKFNIKMVDSPLEYLRGIHWVTSVFSLHPSRRCPAWSRTWARGRGRPRPSWGRWWGWPGCSGWRSSACPPTSPSPAGSTGRASSGCRLSLHSALETLGAGPGDLTLLIWLGHEVLAGAGAHPEAGALDLVLGADAAAVVAHPLHAVLPATPTINTQLKSQGPLET